MNNPKKLNGAQIGPCWFALHYGGCTRPVLRVIPDRQWPGMYRVYWRDGRLSEPANLSRCLDAAAAFAERLRNDRRAEGLYGQLPFHWKQHRSPEAVP